jgi:phosphomethylpyrimidine synthase
MTIAKVTSNIGSKANTNADAPSSMDATLHIPANAQNENNSKADKKADALKTPAHRAVGDARFEEDARDLHRILPASRKVYIEGSRPDIQVPMREISLADTPVGGTGDENGEHNPPFYVYDT